MFMVLSCHRSSKPLREFTRFIMNVERRQAATDPQTRTNDPVCECRLYRLPEATPTIAIYYYYSTLKLILILPSHP